MLHVKRTYILAPTTDTPPSGPIVLGQLIRHLHSPELALAPPLPLPDSIALRTSYRTNWTGATAASKSLTLGLVTQFLQLTPLAVDFGTTSTRGVTTVFNAERMEKAWFVPTDKYVLQSLQQPDVQRALFSSTFRRPIYMITGLMVVRGAKATVDVLRKRGAEVAFSVSGLAHGVPLSGGPKVGGELERKTTESWEGGSDFVLAFQVSSVRVGRRGRLQHGPYTKGAIFSVKAEKGENEEYEIAVEDGSAETLGLNGGKTLDIDDEECEWCAPPARPTDDD